MVDKKKIEKNVAKKKSKSILIGSIVALIIGITPYLFYLYDYFPDQPVYETWFFTYESKFNKSIWVTAWLVTGKLIPLLLLILWFFTCKHWWYHIILIPLSMYAFQLFSIFQEDINEFDQIEIYWLIPIMLVVTPFVYFIRVKLFDKYVLGIDLEAIDAELKQYKEKERLQKEKEAESKVHRAQG
jgi:magnesium-transporting ATPase (P-type)